MNLVSCSPAASKAQFSSFASLSHSASSRGLSHSCSTTSVRSACSLVSETERDGRIALPQIVTTDVQFTTSLQPNGVINTVSSWDDVISGLYTILDQSSMNSLHLEYTRQVITYVYLCLILVKCAKDKH